MFFRLTLSETQRWFAGAAARERRLHNRLAVLAWNTAALTRARDMGSLDRLLMPDPTPRPKAQTPSDQLAIARLLDRAINAPRRRHEELKAKRKSKRRTDGDE